MRTRLKLLWLMTVTFLGYFILEEAAHRYTGLNMLCRVRKSHDRQLRAVGLFILLLMIYIYTMANATQDKDTGFRRKVVT